MAAFQISRKVDYALRALIYLARHGGEPACTLGTIAAGIDVSPQFLAKIVEELGHRGLVRSRRGSRGGYALGRAAAEITFNDVIEAVEGPIALNICLDGQGDCTLLGACGMQPVWQEAQRRLVDVFAQTTLADVGAACQGGCASGVGRPQTLAAAARDPGMRSGAPEVAPLVADPVPTTGVPSGRGGS
jgi:Rrf2 family protein